MDERDTFGVAEVPGLVEGSHLNRGLGHKFLRHIERTKLIVYMLDASTGEPRLQLEQLESELHTYSPELARRPFLTALNKIDLIADAGVRERMRLSVDGDRAYVISALTGEGVPAFLRALSRTLERVEGGA